MKLNEGLIAGSGRWDELVVIHHSAESSPVHLSSRRICQICGDEIGCSSVDGEPFVACNECAFPICSTCYDYERQEASQLCPLCKTRFKRIKGFARVEGDPEEDDADDVENEFNFVGSKRTDVLTSGNHGHDDTIYHEPYDAAADADTLSCCKLSLDPQQASSLHHTCGHMVVYGGGGEGGEQKRKRFPSPDPASNRSLDPSKDMASYGYGSVAWKERMELWKQKQETLQIVKNEAKDDGDGIELQLHLIDEARQPLSRKLAIPSTQINPYRIIVIIRLVVLGFFFQYRVTHPVKNAFGLWFVSVICEVWFALSWILDQLPKWFPLGGRETYLDRLSLRYEKEGKQSELCPVDIFVSTVDPMKEPPLVTANTLLSILAVDYPVDKVSCYVSDDGAAMLTFEALSETSEFAKKWVPFCKRFNIEPRAPEGYFSKKIDYFNNMVLASFVRERRAMKREYDEFKVRINALVTKAQKIPEEGWTMQDGTPWPGNNVRDHPGIIQVFLGQKGEENDRNDENDLPRLVYVSREKKPGYNHHKKAGAMNALVRVSAVLTNATYLLNLDFDHYMNNSKALREAMCFLMDPLSGKRVCYVQFSPRFDGVDAESNNNVFLDINMRALDGIQGPMYVGTGSVFRRKAFYGYDAPPKRHKSRKSSCNCCPKWSCFGCCSSVSKRKSRNKSKSEMKTLRQDDDDDDDDDDDISAVGWMPLQDMEQEADKQLLKAQNKLEKKFGQSPVFVAATLQENGGTVKGFNPASLLKEAIHVISCGYEDKTEWGTEVGWIYGSDKLTGFKMHCHGWRSIYSTPERSAFRGSAPIDLSDRLHQVLRLALGSADIFLSRHCPLWYGYGGGLKFLERLSYVNATIYPLTSVPLVAYCTLPAVCLLTGKFIVPELSSTASIWFLLVFMCIFGTGILEMRWSGGSMYEWWENEQFRVMGGVSAHLVAAFTSMVKMVAGYDDTNHNNNFLSVPSNSKAGELYAFEWTMILMPPITLLVINLIGVIAGVSNAISTGYGAWGALFGKLFYAFCVLVHLYPFLKGLFLKKKRAPTIIILWSLLIASVFSLLWIKMDPFLAKSNAKMLVECGLDCTIL